MREDQRIRLVEVSERLAEAAITDADPDNWTANGKLLCDMDQKERGDAAWCRKTAVQTVALLMRMESLLQADSPAATNPSAPDPEDEIKRAEKMARDAVERIGKAVSAKA